MEEIALGYPAGSLIVSTGLMPESAAGDVRLPNRVDRVDVPAGRLKTAPGLLRWAHRATKLARDPRARFAWCGNIRPAAFPAKWAKERTGLPYGIMVYGGDLLALSHKLSRSRLKRQIYRPILAEAAVYVAISEWTATRCRQLLQGLGIPDQGRVRIVPLGTDPERFRPDPKGGAEFRARRGLPDGKWMLTVARLVPHKGIDMTIQVLGGLALTQPDLRYLVIGRGPHEAALQELARSLGVTDRLHILTDVGDDELPSAYASADYYLGLSREDGLDAEGFGISLVEAAAAGLPVIGGRSGGVADAVADGETGQLVDPLDPQQAADAVHHLLNDSALAERLGEAGRVRVLRGYTWPRVVGDLRAIAEELGRA